MQFAKLKSAKKVCIPVLLIAAFVSIAICGETFGQPSKIEGLESKDSKVRIEAISQLQKPKFESSKTFAQVIDCLFASETDLQRVAKDWIIQASPDIVAKADRDNGTPVALIAMRFLFSKPQISGDRALVDHFRQAARLNGKAGEVALNVEALLSNADESASLLTAVINNRAAGLWTRISAALRLRRCRLVASEDAESLANIVSNKSEPEWLRSCVGNSIIATESVKTQPVIVKMVKLSLKDPEDDVLAQTLIIAIAGKYQLSSAVASDVRDSLRNSVERVRRAGLVRFFVRAPIDEASLPVLVEVAYNTRDHFDARIVAVEAIARHGALARNYENDLLEILTQVRNDSPELDDQIGFAIRNFGTPEESIKTLKKLRADVSSRKRLTTRIDRVLSIVTTN